MSLGVPPLTHKLSDVMTVSSLGITTRLEGGQWVVAGGQREPARTRALTAVLGRVAELQVLTGAGRVLLGAVGAAHGLDLAAEGLEGGVDAGVRLVLVIRSRLVFRELWEWVWHVLIVVPQDVPEGGGEVARGTRRARRARLARRTLMGKNIGNT